MDKWLNLLDKNGIFFELSIDEIKILHEDEKEMTILYRVDMDIQEELQIEKEISNNLLEEMKPFGANDVLRVRFEAEIDDMEYSYITWVHTDMFTLQLRYFEENISGGGSIFLHAYVIGFGSRSYEQLNKESQQTVKQITSCYKEFLEHMYKTKVKYEKEFHYFMFDTPIEERYVIKLEQSEEDMFRINEVTESGRDITLEEILEWVDEDYQNYTNYSDCDAAEAISMISVEYHMIGRNNLYYYAILYRLIEFTKRDIHEKEAKNNILRSLQDEQNVIRTRLVPKQIELLKEKKLW